MLATLILLVAFAIGLLYVRRELRSVYRKLAVIENRLGAPGSIEQQLSHQFRQIEALMGLYTDLKPDRSLPETRGWAASPDFLLMLVTHAKEAKPRMIVECGSGCSTVVLARTLALTGAEGRIYSLEHIAEFRQRTIEELVRHEVASLATVLHAPLREYALPSGKWRWYTLEELPDGEIDMLIVDGPPGTIGPLARYPAGPLLFGRLARHASIFVDDTGRADEGMLIARWMEEYPDLVQEVGTCEKGCVVLRR